MSVTLNVTAHVSGAALPLTISLDTEALAVIASALPIQQTDDRELLTIPQAAEMCGVRRCTIDAWLSARRLPRVKAGRRTLIRRADIDAFLENETETRR